MAYKFQREWKELSKKKDEEYKIFKISIIDNLKTLWRNWKKDKEKKLTF